VDSDAGVDSTKNMSIQTFQSPQLKQNEAKVLVCVGQNADGSHIYKSFDIFTDPTKPLASSSTAGVVTNTLSMQSKAVAPGQEKVPMVLTQQGNYQPSASSVCTQVTACPQVLSGGNMLGNIPSLTPLYTTGGPGVSLPITGGPGVSLPITMPSNLTNQLCCIRTADGRMIINLPTSGQGLASPIPFPNTSTVLQKTIQAPTQANVINIGQPSVQFIQNNVIGTANNNLSGGSTMANTGQINAVPAPPIMQNVIPQPRLQIVQTPTGQFIIQPQQNIPTSVANTNSSVSTNAPKPVVIGHCGKGPIVLDSNEALTIQGALPTVSTSATPAIMKTVNQSSNMFPKAQPTIQPLVQSQSTNPSNVPPLQGYIDGEGRLHITAQSNTQSSQQLQLQPNQRYVINSRMDPPIRPVLPAHVASKPAQQSNSPASYVIRPNGNVVTQRLPALSKAGQVAQAKPDNTKSSTIATTTTVVPSTTKTPSPPRGNTDSLVLCPITGLLKYPNRDHEKLITKPIGEVNVQKLLEIAKGKAHGSETTSRKSKNTATVNPMRNVAQQKPKWKTISPQIPKEQRDKFKTFVIKDNEGSDGADSDESVTPKPASPWTGRRQTDVNIGRERSIRPKDNLSSVKVCDIVPDVEIMQQDASDGDDVSLMRLNYTDCSQDTSAKTADSEDDDSYDSDTSSELIGQSNYSIVELIKQDLQKKMEPDLKKEDLQKKMEPEPRTVTPDDMKVCAVILHKLNLRGKSTVDLKTWRVSEMGISPLTKRCVRSLGKEQQLSSHKQKRKDDVLLSDISDLTDSTETSTDEDYFLSIRKQRQKKLKLAKREKNKRSCTRKQSGGPKKKYPS
jgi:hypothetical protein